MAAFTMSNGVNVDHITAPSLSVLTPLAARGSSALGFFVLDNL